MSAVEKSVALVSEFAGDLPYESCLVCRGGWWYADDGSALYAVHHNECPNRDKPAGGSGGEPEK